MLIFICGFVGEKYQERRVVCADMYKGFRLRDDEVRTGVLNFQENAGGVLHNDAPADWLLKMTVKQAINQALSIHAYRGTVYKMLPGVDAWLAGSSSSVTEDSAKQVLSALPAYTSEVIYVGY